MIFEGNQFSCTHSPGGMPINNQGNFSVDLWVYVNILYSQSLFVCKFYKLTNSAPNERFCIGFDGSGQMLVRMNQANYDQSNLRDHLYLTTCKYDYSGLVTTGTYTWGDTINDDPANNGYLCCGGTVAYGYSAGSGGFNSPFTGIVNMVQFFQGTTLSAADITNLYSTDCESWCKICQDLGASPNKCFQQKSGYLQKYDFDLTTYPTSQIQIDDSGYGHDLTVNQNFAFTPSYVDQQGLWFDLSYASSNQYLRSPKSTFYPTASKSFTLETWFRPTATVANTMSIFEKESAAVTNYIRWGFWSSSQIQIIMNGVSQILSLGSTIVINQWHYMAVSVVQYQTNYSRMCMKYDTVAWYCVNHYLTLSESGTGITQIGDGFQGYIKSIYVYDYAKEQQDMTGTFMTSGCSASQNGQTCTLCPRSTGQCNVNCAFGFYANSTNNQCTTCYPNCRTCWGAYGDNCFSCIKTPAIWTFDYDTKCLSKCGDGFRDDYEECDDSNVVNGDGCSSICQLESGWDCAGGSFTGRDTCYRICGSGIPIAGGCDDGNTNSGDGCNSVCKVESGYSCSGTPSICTSVCGDSRRIASEECDDGNTINGDGCSSTCKIESGFNCTGGDQIQKDICREICGDGKDFGKYACEDGNLVNFDGCDQNCKVEVGFTCTGGTSTKKDTCTEICGDGRNFKTSLNQCDDGNTINGDGCSSACKVETGFSCSAGSSYTKDQCTEICGDGLNFGNFQCDDGNNIDGDGCHSDCSIEIGFVCSGGNKTTADTCKEICGDGKNFGTYPCDDGNLFNGDGCNSTCQVEQYYTCTKGDPFYASICKKTCDGKRDFSDQCDDGNTVSGDGCDSNCQREIGYSCSGGSLSTSDSCTESCGDGMRFNILPCDDGNIVSGDGCSSTCNIEAGFTCSGGSIFSADKCQEICGDDKNMGMYECDDGNTASNDGCSYNCMIEQGFTCTKGNATRASVCKEICGDGKNMKSYLMECDDGNTFSGDGCSNKCIIEAGYTCEQGGPYTPDICTETCGDGINLGNYECDDGNPQDGDGCSSECFVEAGYECKGGSTTQADQCIAISNPYITFAEYEGQGRKITLQFSEKVYLSQSWNKSSASWRIDIYGPLGYGNYLYEWDVQKVQIYKDKTQKGTATMEVNLMIFSQLYGNGMERVVLSFDDKETILSYDKNIKLLNSSVVVYPPGQTGTLTGENDPSYSSMLGLLSSSLIYTSFGLSAIASFFGHSCGNLWIMTQTLQQIYLFPVNNLQVPSAISNYILNLEGAMPQSSLLGYLSLGSSTNYTHITKSNPPPSFTYTKMGFASNAFLYNAADVLSLFICCLAVKSLFEVVKILSPQNPKRQISLARINDSIQFGYLAFAYNKLAFASHLNLKHINFDDAQNSISSLLSLGIAVGCWMYPFYTCYQSHQLYLHLEKMQKSSKNEKLSEMQIRDSSHFRANILLQDYSISPETKISFPINIFFPAMNQLRSLIMACLIVSDDSKTQLQGAMIINFLMLTTSLLLQPFQSRLMNIQLIFAEISVIIVYMQAHQFFPIPVINNKNSQSVSETFIAVIFMIVATQTSFVIFSKLVQITQCKNVSRSSVPLGKLKSSNTSKPVTKPVKNKGTVQIQPTKQEEKFDRIHDQKEIPFQKNQPKITTQPLSIQKQKINPKEEEKIEQRANKEEKKKQQRKQQSEQSDSFSDGSSEDSRSYYDSEYNSESVDDSYYSNESSGSNESSLRSRSSNYRTQRR